MSHVANLEKKVAYLEKHSKNGMASTLLHDVLRDAHQSPVWVSQRILLLVQGVPDQYDVLLGIANLCLKGPVGRVGERRVLRAVAVLLVDHIIEKDEKNVRAICLKGEILTSNIQHGYNDPFTPRSVLQEAFCMFQRASESGDPLALFLQGHWLVINAPLHRVPAHVEEGRNLILQAIDRRCSRAINYFVESIESADFESKNVADELGSFFHRLPTNARGSTKQSRLAREQFIFKLYIESAKLGNPLAFNDLGASFADGYAGLEPNFDLATFFYMSSIKLGECTSDFMAYENLGTHLETGHNGLCPEKVDREKALYYYREGARRRVAKCAYYLGASYEDGVPKVLEKSSTLAKDYYIHAIKLADDSYDSSTATQALRNLTSMMLAEIKMCTNPKGERCTRMMQDLAKLVGDEAVVSRSMSQLNGAILSALRSKTGRCPLLGQIVGESHAKTIMSHAKRIERSLKAGENKAVNEALYEHLVGVPYFGVSVSSARQRRHGNIKQAATSTRSVVRNKRRKVID